MVETNKIARQLSYAAQIAQDFERRYGLHALIRERQDLLKAFEPPQHIKAMLEIENAARAAFANPFEQMMRSIRPSIDDLRLRAGFDSSTLSSIQNAAASLSRPSDIVRQISAFEGLGYSSINQLMASQSAMADAALGIRKSMAAVKLPDLFPHDRIAGTLAGVQVLSEQSEAMRLSAKAALESILGYQSFAERQLRRAVTDDPIVFSRRMTITDMAGDLLETAQSSWELLGIQATVVPDDQTLEIPKPTIYPHLNQELSYLYREDVTADPEIAFDRSNASIVATLGGEIVELIYNINESRNSYGKTHIITPTNRTMRAVHQLTASVSKDEYSFGKIVDALYFLIYEGSGSAKRLTEIMTDEELTTVWWIKTLRTSIRHDIDHGDERKSQKKHIEIGEVYSALVGQKRPKRGTDWTTAQVVLFEHTANFLRRVLNIIDPD